MQLPHLLGTPAARYCVLIGSVTTRVQKDTMLKVTNNGGMILMNMEVNSEDRNLSSGSVGFHHRPRWLPPLDGDLMLTSFAGVVYHESFPFSAGNGSNEHWPSPSFYQGHCPQHHSRMHESRRHQNCGSAEL